jgi:predicted small metal-binding protein
MNMKERLQLCNCNFEIFLTQKSIKEINESMVVHIKAKVTEQVILCQFINYLIQNSMLFLDDDHMLYSLMSNNLYHLTEIFKWDENKCLKDMKSEYILPSGNVRITEENYRKILLYL